MQKGAECSKEKLNARQDIMIKFHQKIWIFYYIEFLEIDNWCKQNGWFVFFELELIVTRQKGS